MKTIRILFLLAFSMFRLPQHCSAQKTKQIEIPDPFQFQITDSASLPFYDLYMNGYSWMAKTFSGDGESILLHEKDAGKLMARAAIYYAGTSGLFGQESTNNRVTFIFTLEVKDGKFRASLTDFMLVDATITYSDISGHNITSNTSYFISLDTKQDEHDSDNKFWRNLKQHCFEQANQLLSELDKQMHFAPEKF